MQSRIKRDHVARVGVIGDYGRHVPTAERRLLHVPVGDVAPEGVNAVAVEIITPATGPLQPLIWWMLPGGSMSRRYWDLRGGDGTFSCAEFLADHGYVCALVDHPGVGDSDVPDDAYQLTTTVLADVNAAARQRIEAMLPEVFDGRATIGCGHSMGGKITVLTEARHRCHTALCLLGSSGRGLPQMIDDHERSYADRPEALRADAAQLAQRRFGEALQLRPFNGAEVLNEALAPLLTIAGLSSMIPGNISDATAQIDVPVMIARGEHDIAASLDATAAEFTGTDRLHLFELPAAGHNHNAGTNRQAMWQAMLDWAGSLG